MSSAYQRTTSRRLRSAFPCVLFLSCVAAVGQLPSELREDSQLARILSKSEYVTAEDLVSLCTSDEQISVDFCRGYLLRATHFWKTATACASELAGEQSFCAGINSAQENIQKAFEGCLDCEGEEFEPVLDWCRTDTQRDRHFCAGYNEELASQFTSMPSLTASTRGWGAEAADGDAFAHSFASREFVSLEPCVGSTTTRQELQDVFIRFVAENSGERRATAFMALARAQFYNFCAEAPPGSKPHMEICTDFSFEDGQMRTINDCEEAVFVQFRGVDQPVVERSLEPGERFATGFERRGPYVYTTCPDGYQSSLPLDEENRSEIGGSHYSCIAK